MNLLEKIPEVIIHAGIVLGFFTGTVLVSRKFRYTQFLLMLIVVNLSLIVFHNYYIGRIIQSVIKSPFAASEPFIFLLPPLFLFYIRSLLDSESRIRLSDARHFAPFFLYFISFVPVYLYGKDSEYYRFLYSNSNILTLFLWLIVMVQYLYYLSVTGRLVHSYDDLLKQEFSEPRKFDISWTRFFLSAFLLTCIFNLIILIILMHTGRFEYFREIVSLMFSVSVFYISFKVLRPNTSGIPVDRQKPDTKLVGSTDKEDVRMLQLKSELLAFMEKNKPYLNAELTLTALASEIGISRNQLSFLINNVLDDNFYNFVNTYRIGCVKKLIADPEKRNFTILALAIESGFNSKSSFNNTFKRITGLTPSEYRNGLL